MDPSRGPAARPECQWREAAAAAGVQHLRAQRKDHDGTSCQLSYHGVYLNPNKENVLRPSNDKPTMQE